MTIRNKKKELERLRKAFEEEADRYHDINLSIIYATQDWISREGQFGQPNHGIQLWQYYGKIETEESIKQLVENIKTSENKYGVRGSKYSAFAMLEGEKIDLFLRISRRAGKLFSDKELKLIERNVDLELIENDKDEGKPVSVKNDNSIAMWLNYVLYNTSVSHPKRFAETVVNLDPFLESLHAIEQLLENKTISRGKRIISNIEDIQFKVAVSFPGEKREFVSEVVELVKTELGQDSVFYDIDYQSQLARPNLDILLQKVYRDNSDIIVVFLCEEYDEKEWCGIEWRAIRDIIKSRSDEKVMFMRFDNADIKGLFSIDGYVSLVDTTPEVAGRYIVERIQANEAKIS
ncbi:MAG: TIR domain-containing protein [Gammaproteobacteria bacterium]|nr:TIR domain-containing protein [Gammaproteobacteria bacterium]